MNRKILSLLCSTCSKDQSDIEAMTFAALEMNIKFSHKKDFNT